jgi:hypothetical protein
VLLGKYFGFCALNFYEFTALEFFSFKLVYLLSKESL